MTETENTSDLIIEAYKEIVESTGLPPTRVNLLEKGFKRDTIRYHFGSLERLHEFMERKHKEFLTKHFASVQEVFARKWSTDKTTFIITTAVGDTKAHKGFLAAMDTFCEKNNAQAVIMPCESVTNSFENGSATFDSAFNDSKYLFVNEDIQLNSNLTLASVQVSAKNVRPITGLSRLGNREGTFIFASPKQFLEYVPSGNSRGNNFGIMTTGACTIPDYYNNVYVSKRLSYIADFDHTMGGVIVEIKDDKTFTFRHFQADEAGNIFDMGRKYSPKGEVYSVPVSVVMGDLHATEADEDVLEYFLNLFHTMDVDNVFLHDIFEGVSISHHIKDIVDMSMRSIEGKASLREELAHTGAMVSQIHNRIAPKIRTYIVKSNHDEFLDRYLREGRYINDPTNHYSALMIAPSLFEDSDTLEYGITLAESGNTKDPLWSQNNIVFLSREDSFKIGGVECAAHGDLGQNGAKAGLASLEKIYGNCIVGHAHSAAIHRGVFRVGTLTKLNMGYNRGPSTWTHTCGIVYEDGQKQLINADYSEFTESEILD